MVARYDGGFIPEGIAITCNQYGKGRAYYIGTQPGAELLNALTERIAKDAGVQFGLPTPEGVEACVVRWMITRSLSSSTTPTTLKPSPLRSRVRPISGKPVEGSITMDSYGVAVLK